MIGGIYRQLEVRNMQVDHRETGEAPRTTSVACNVIRGSLGNLIEWYDWYAYAASASTSQACSSHRESDSAAVEHRWHLRGRLPRLAARRLDVRSVCRPIWAAPEVRQSLTVITHALVQPGIRPPKQDGSLPDRVGRLNPVGGGECGGLGCHSS